ncbi:MAG: nitroreductase family protein [Rectinemataceae bacterium]|nr:nitroreductase family protein [Spirochaetaceae bacterium]
MDLLQEIELRRARRGLSGEALDEATMHRLLTAATLAPSCFNHQPWRMIAVENAAGNPAAEALAAALTAGNAWARKAAWFVVCCTAPHLDCRLDEGRDYSYFDLGQAAFALQMQAQHEGLIAHPMAGFSPSKVRMALSIPADIVPLAVLAIGKPGSTELLNEGQIQKETAPRDRKPLEEVAFRNTYGQSF